MDAPARQARPFRSLLATAASMLLVLAWAPAGADARQPAVHAFDSLATIRADQPLPPGASSSARISAAGNEFESFQVAVQAGSAPLAGVRVEPGRVLSGPGGATIPASNLTIYREADYQVSRRSDAEGATGSWPDALIPERDPFYGEDRNAFPVDLAAGQRVVAWIDVLVPRSAPAGEYEGSITVSGEGGQVAEIPVELTVHDFVLPSTSTLRSLFHIKGITLPGGDQSLYAVAALNNRVTLANLWPFPESRFVANILPLLEGTDPRVRLPGARLTAIDAMRCAANCLVPWRNLAQKYPIVAERFVDYICDEPSTPAEWDDCHATAAEAESIWPGVRKLITTNAAKTPSWASDLSPLVNDIHRDGQVAYGAWHGAEGRRNLWPYTSCRSFSCNESESPEFNGWPGYAIDQPASQARAMGWLAFSTGATGELHWSTTQKLSTAWTDQYLSGGNGDGTMFYPGTTDVIGGDHAIPVESMRLKRIRDGREDYEYLHYLAQQGREGDARSAAQSLFPSMRHTTVSPAQLVSARSMVAGMVEGGDYVPSPSGVQSGADEAPAPSAAPKQDSISPAVTITGGPSGQTRDRTPTFRFTSSEPNSAFVCRQDRGAWSSCSGSFSFRRLGYGRHVFSVRVRDAAGNWDRMPQRRYFKVVRPAVR